MVNGVPYVRIGGVRGSPTRNYESTRTLRIDAIINSRYYRIGYIDANNAFFPCASLGGPEPPVSQVPVASGEPF